MRDAAREARDGFHLFQPCNALGKALPFGDVAKAPHASNAPAGNTLWLRVALERAAVLELENVETLCIALRVELLHFREELRGVLELVEHICDRCPVVTAVEHCGGDAPHLGELPVVAHHPTFGI